MLKCTGNFKLLYIDESPTNSLRLERLSQLANKTYPSLSNPIFRNLGPTGICGRLTNEIYHHYTPLISRIQIAYVALFDGLVLRLSAILKAKQRWEGNTCVFARTCGLGFYVNKYDI